MSCDGGDYYMNEIIKKHEDAHDHEKWKNEQLVEVAHMYEDKIEDMQATMRLMVSRIEELEEPK